MFLYDGHNPIFFLWLRNLWFLVSTISGPVENPVHSHPPLPPPIWGAFGASSSHTLIVQFYGHPNAFAFFGYTCFACLIYLPTDTLNTPVTPQLSVLDKSWPRSPLSIAVGGYVLAFPRCTALRIIINRFSIVSPCRNFRDGIAEKPACVLSIANALLLSLALRPPPTTHPIPVISAFIIKDV